MTQTPTLIPRYSRPEQHPSPKTGEPTTDPTASKVLNRLSQSPYRELKNVSCGTRNGVLVLRGTVSSFYLKQMAQEIALRTEGIEAIANQLEVDSLEN